MAARHFSSNPTLKKKIVQKNGQEFVIDIFARWFIFCYREKKNGSHQPVRFQPFRNPSIMECSRKLRVGRAQSGKQGAAIVNPKEGVDSPYYPPWN